MRHASNKIPKIGLVGVSGFARNHLKTLHALAANQEVQISCATIINQSEEPEACQELQKIGCRIYDDFDKMVKAEAHALDLCVIPTGIALHCRMTIAALEAGWNVLVEKPVAGTIAEVDEMIAARDQAKLRVFVGYQDLYQDATNDIKNRLLAGAIGTVSHIKVMASWPRPIYYYQRNNWAGKIRDGDHFVYDSPANNALAHFLMASLYFSGNKLHSAANVAEFEASLFRAQSIETFDTISAKMRTDTGVEILYNVTHSGSTLIEPIIEISGSTGSVHWEFRKHFRIFPSGELIPTVDSMEARSTEFRKILHAIRTGEAAGASLEVARTHTDFINQLHAQCVIEDIPSDLIDCSYNSEDHAHRSIQGIENCIKKSFISNRRLTIEEIEKTNHTTPSSLTAL
ncbi:Gfo/Idh/MocA family oxidoreductase [Coraliomargarita sp. SDUM461004]|uniref:Gfo/Idh/MocA family oxidoreductase n=1 Tax=Thalassobacterium sedimentorum TaxID=3041258 RepID=A0ABU1AIZ4_9BACT|nr:Gfo/Idh/MocA family oxidoreductase [Coraliomargarita sp. SDUM461004]MDQ8194792.1 Gfo/Idh/MocA family oxidoreductase [Coraliomargarita sp. SDUM461004]